MNLTIAVCTFNRSSLLEDCLEGLYRLENINSVNILVVNNNSSDDTYLICKKFLTKSNFSYVVEYSIGLSFARNRAISECETSWISFIDDDVLVNQKWLDNSILQIQKNDCDMFGGSFYPYYKRKSAFYYDELGSSYYSLPFEGDQFLINHYLCGGNMFIKKCIFEKDISFDSKFGKSGTVDLYGEEVIVQIEMDRMKFLRKFIHNIPVEHYVPYEKQKFWWLVKNINQRAKSNLLVYKNYSIVKKQNLFKKLDLSFKQTILHFSLKLISRFIYKFWKIRYY